MNNNKVIALLNTPSSPLWGTSPARGEVSHVWGFTQSWFPKGFTLIELLVVVLIIGILAAVAVPQYKKAVMKARFANLRVTGEALASAIEVYYLAHGDWPNDFEQLDKQLPTSTDSSTVFGGNCRSYEGFYCCIIYPSSTGGNVSGSVMCGAEDLSIVYGHVYSNFTGQRELPPSHTCSQQPDVHICEFLPGAKIKFTNDNIPTPSMYGWKSGYVSYRID